MAAKYEPQENEMPEQVNEPIAAYQRTASDMSLYIPTEYEREIIMRSEKDYEEGRLYTQEEFVDRNCYNCFAADFDFLSCKKRKFQI